MKNLSYWISPKYLDSKNIIKFRKNFFSKEFIKIIELENFFNDNIINKVFSELKQKKSKFEFNDSYANGVVNVDFYSYNSIFLEEFKNFLGSDIFLKFISLFFGKKIGYVNNRELINKYSKGGILIQTLNNKNYIKWHDDIDDEGMYILYLNEDYNENMGGFLELGYKNGNEFICYDKILPKPNTLVLFMPKKGFYHQVSSMVDGFERKNIVEHLYFK